MTRIMTRSLVEYILDLTLIAQRDCRTTNEAFAGYAILVRYWDKDGLDTYRNKIPEINREYREYVDHQKKTNGLLSKHIDVNEETGLVDYDKTAVSLKSHYRGSWTGMDARKRFKTVVVEAIFGSDIENPEGIWDSAENKLKRIERKVWDDWSEYERVEHTIRRLIASVDGTTAHDTEHLFMLIQDSLEHFYFYSKFVHPTGFGVIQSYWQTPSDSASKWGWTPDSWLCDAEFELYLLLNAAVASFVLCLSPCDREELTMEFNRSVEKSPHLVTRFTSES
ncbi:MAG: hypothetical protein KOO62_11525 [candidate division Zixibacteria bacterium]|nr:hypothetical protein [candidate division Zixibacteria bacterium]